MRYVQQEPTLKLDQDPLIFPELWEILYCSEPRWIFTIKGYAESECRRLNRMNAALGLHYCRFDVENLSDGKFTLVCPTHPDEDTPATTRLP